MKKLLSIVALAAIALTASAQRANSDSNSYSQMEGVQFGVQGGLNISSMTDFDSKIGYNAGVTVDIPVAGNFFISSGLLLTEKGAKYTIDEEEDYGAEEKVNPLYLEVPVLASYRFALNDAIKLDVKAGPYLAFGIAGKYKVSAADEEAECDLFSEDGADWKSFDMGAQIGTSLLFAGHYSLGVAYQFGFTKVYDGDDAPKNSNFMINLGYKF